MEDFVLFREHRARNQGFLTHFAVNPIFGTQSRAILGECMRLYRKTVLYHRLFAGDGVAAPPCLPEMVQVKPRQLSLPTAGGDGGAAAAGGEAKEPKQAGMDDDDGGGDAPDDGMGDGVAKLGADGDFALHFLSKKLLSEPKLNNNTRVVVVGTSDCALAMLEALLIVPYLHFTSLTLLAPGGLPTEDSDAFADCVPDTATGFSVRQIRQVPTYPRAHAAAII
jgi:hypothetical protein